MLTDYYFPCPLCKRVLKVEITKNDKPYCTCNDCGVQLFVRGKLGIKRLSKLTGQMEIKGNTKDLINTIDLYNCLKSKLEEVQGKRLVLGNDLDLELQEKVLTKQIERLRLNLEKEDRDKQ